MSFEVWWIGQSVAVAVSHRDMPGLRTVGTVRGNSPHQIHIEHICCHSESWCVHEYSLTCECRGHHWRQQRQQGKDKQLGETSAQSIIHHKRKWASDCRAHWLYYDSFASHEDKQTPMAALHCTVSSMYKQNITAPSWISIFFFLRFVVFGCSVNLLNELCWTRVSGRSTTKIKHWSVWRARYSGWCFRVFATMLTATIMSMINDCVCVRLHREPTKIAIETDGPVNRSELKIRIYHLSIFGGGVCISA